MHILHISLFSQFLWFICIQLQCWIASLRARNDVCFLLVLDVERWSNPGNVTIRTALRWIFDLSGRKEAYILWYFRSFALLSKGGNILGSASSSDNSTTFLSNKQQDDLVSVYCLFFPRFWQKFWYMQLCDMCEEILSQIKPKLLSNSHPGVYQLDCSCNGRYIGESKKKVLIRCIEHHPDSTKGNFESSGTTENTTACHGQFNRIHLKTISVMQNMYKRKVHEALKINRIRALKRSNY